jgi:hypothetical protein
MKANKLVLYEFEWQALRTSLDFSTIEGVEASLAKLRTYVTNKICYNRIWRVLNLLCATRAGFSGQRKLRGNSATLDACDSQVACMRMTLTKMLRRRKRHGSTFDLTEVEQATQARLIGQALEEAVRRVEASLMKRYTGSGCSEHRPELEYYLQLLHRRH